MAHIPGFDKGTGEHQTISFESVCAPGHYVRQKNYRFVLGKQGDTKFSKSKSILENHAQLEFRAVRLYFTWIWPKYAKFT